MEKSETIVADPTCRLGNHLHASSGDNAPASASWGRAEGLASRWAVTLRNHCSVVKSTTRTRFEWSSWHAEPLHARRRRYPRASSDMCTCGVLRRRGDGKTAIVTEVQSGDDPHSISAFSGMRDANAGSVWECGAAHGVIVAMKSAITSRRSEGPLGFRGHGMCESSGYIALTGYKIPNEKLRHASHGEARGKLVERQAVSDGRTRKLGTGFAQCDHPGF
jgi:hypothetical protein